MTHDSFYMCDMTHSTHIEHMTRSKCVTKRVDHMTHDPFYMCDMTYSTHIEQAIAEW